MSGTLTPLSFMQAGTEILSESGVSGLNIVALCERLGVTRGSFYHHFGGLADFEAQFLTYWEDVTSERAAPVTLAPTFRERSEVAIRTLENIDFGAERAMRAWSLDDQRVAEMLRRTDRRTVDVVRQSIVAAGAPEEVADTYAEMAVLMWIGLVVRPEPLRKDTIRRLFSELQSAVDSHAGLSSAKVAGGGRDRG